MYVICVYYVYTYTTNIYVYTSIAHLWLCLVWDDNITFKHIYIYTFIFVFINTIDACTPVKMGLSLADIQGPVLYSVAMDKAWYSHDRRIFGWSGTWKLVKDLMSSAFNTIYPPVQLDDGIWSHDGWSELWTTIDWGFTRQRVINRYYFTTLEFVTSNFWYGVSLRPPGLPPPGISECDMVCYDVVWLSFPRFEHIKPYIKNV